MDAIECARCGETFVNEANLLRHLRKSISCPPSKSILDRRYIIAERVRMLGKVFPCEYCPKIFKHASSRCKHRKTCAPYLAYVEATTTPAKLAAKMDSIQKEMEKVSQSMAKMAAAAPIPQTSQTIANSGAMAVGGGSANQNTLNIYPILPWSATDVDFTPLSDKLNNRLAQAFALKEQVESLMLMRMKHDPPQNYSAYITADDVDSIRFFDGRAYKRVEDPRREIDRFYDTCHASLDEHSTDPKNRFDLDFWCDERQTTYEAQRELLERAAGSHTRYEAICDRLKRCAPAILKEIEELGLEVEQ